MIADSRSREVDDRVQAAHSREIAFIDDAARGIPAHGVADELLGRGTNEGHRGVTSLVQCFDERATDQTRRTGHTDAHSWSQRC